MDGKRTLWVSALLVAAALGLGARAADKGSLHAEVEGFKVTYQPLETPSTGWGTQKEEEWITAFQGTLKSDKPLSYRGVTLAAGTHDVWVAKGNGDWLHLFVGDRDDEDAPRLRSMFKLYEQEQGVDALRFELKLTRRGSKLKFSIFAGRSEGHGNLQVDSGEKQAPKE
ncbi:MAG: hypothetical protein L0Z55_10590 [Planctomycetes bacterium]|nr:hypothetical protein [Planctomycetota bacterium]